MILKAQYGLNTQDIKDNHYANKMQQLNGNIQQGAQQLGQKVQQEIQAEQSPKIKTQDDMINAAIPKLKSMGYDQQAIRTIIRYFVNSDYTYKGPKLK